MMGENILFGLYQREDAYPSMHLAGSPIRCGSNSHPSLCPTVPALRKICHKGFHFIKALYRLNLHCHQFGQTEVWVALYLQLGVSGQTYLSVYLWLDLS